MSPRRPNVPDVPPFPSSGPEAFREEGGTAVLPRMDAQRDRIIEEAIRQATDFFKLENLTGGTLNLDQIVLGSSTAPVVGDFRLILDRATAGTFILRTEEWDSSPEGWQTSGLQLVIAGDEILANFLEYDDAGGATTHVSHTYDWKAFTFRNALNWDDGSGGSQAPYQSFGANDATPDIAGASLWRTANSSPTTITAFDNTDNDGGRKHLFWLLINDANTTIDFSQTALDGNADTSILLQKGDLLTCVRQGGTTPITTCSVPTQPDTAVPEVKGGSASTSGASSNVTHGMVGTPTSVAITPKDQNASDAIASGAVPFVSAAGATTFTVNWDSGGSGTWYWIAVVN